MDEGNGYPAIKKPSQQPQVPLPGKGFLWGGTAALCAEWTIGGCRCCRHITEWLGESRSGEQWNWSSSAHGFRISIIYPPDWDANFLQLQWKLSLMGFGLQACMLLNATGVLHHFELLMSRQHYRHRTAVSPWSWWNSTEAESEVATTRQGLSQHRSSEEESSGGGPLQPRLTTRKHAHTQIVL